MLVFSRVSYLPPSYFVYLLTRESLISFKQPPLGADDATPSLLPDLLFAKQVPTSTTKSIHWLFPILDESVLGTLSTMTVSMAARVLSFLFYSNICYSPQFSYITLRFAESFSCCGLRISPFIRWSPVCRAAHKVGILFCAKRS